MCANIAATLTSKSQEWETPQDLFDILDRQFHFTLDVAATASNAKCANYFTPEMDGLAQDWGDNICWLNPPYGSAIGKWVAKAHSESLKRATVVCLIPARTDTRYFWNYCTQGSIRFIRGRLTFSGYGTAPFPSAIVTFAKHIRPHVSWWDWKEGIYR